MEAVKHTLITFRDRLSGWPVGRVLAGVTAAGFTTFIITRNFQTSSRMSQPATKAAFWKAGPSFLRLRLHSSEQVSPTSKRLRFELPTPDTISGLGLCSAVLSAAWPKGSLFPVLRPYTPVSRLDEPGFLDLTVKHYSGGKMSTHLHSLSPGDTLLIAAVIPSYSWTPNKHEDITLIAGGGGITPLYQLAQGILNNPDDTRTKINLIYGVNKESEILFQDQFDQWRHQFPDRFKATFVVGSPEPGSPHEKGRINADLLSKHMVLPKTGEKSVATKVFVCGPPAMEAALVGKRHDGILKQIGFTKDQVFQF
ncbi:putative cytochrome-b5 reductase [Microsporum audouinii]